MVDVLYGEEVEPRKAFDFFKHLSNCPDCESDYLELLETRELLGQWQIPENGIKTHSSQPGWTFKKKIPWFRWVQKIAAGILIVVGAFAILQYAGLVPQPQNQEISVSDQQLAQMIHDVLVAKQVEDWKVIGTALLSLKEEIEMQNRLSLEGVYQDLDTLRQRYVLALEENNRDVQKLISQ
jgi:hypothetical protein